jgi:hypothetical protein
MNFKFSSKNSLFSCSLSLFNDRRFVSSAVATITFALVLLSSSSSLFLFYVSANDFVAFASSSPVSQSGTTTMPVTPSSPPPPRPSISSESSQTRIEDRAGISADYFNLPDGYVIEPFLSNLSMPTSIAIDSSNRTLYVAESPPPLLELQVRIVKANISGSSNNNVITDQSSDTNSSGGINGDNKTTIVVDNVLNWPVIDMEVDDTSGLLYAFHDPTTIWRINTTSGEREDILATEEEEQQEQETATAVSANGYEEELQDPLSVLINSSSQIVLSGKQENYENMDGEQEEEQEQTGNSDRHHSTVLYIPCINGDIDDYDRYCILSLPIDSNGNSAIVENISGVNSPAQILENMTSRPIGIAILNSSHVVASSPSSISEQQAQGPYALVSSETSSNSFDNNNNYTELLVIGSQPTNNNSISALSTIYHIKVSGSIPYLGIASNNNTGSNSNQNPQLQQALPTTSVESLVGYPDGQLGKVALVSVPPVTSSPSPSSSSSSVNNNESSETNPAASSGEDDEDTTSSSPPFGLNKTAAFIIDYGNNSSASSEALPLQLPKIIMLDVEKGSVTPFLTLNSPDPNFMPIDIAFDYDNRALYVLSSSSNQEEDTDITNDTLSSNNLLNTDTRSNNSGLIWKISYQGLEQEEEAAETSSNSSSISNGTDNGNNATSDLTTPPPPPSSSNDTDSSSNSSDSDSGLDDLPPPSSYDEDPDDTDDGSIDTDDGSIDTDDGSIDTDDGNSGSSNEDTDDDNGDGGGNSSPPETTPPPPDSYSPPSTEPVNNPPIAQVDVAITDQDMPVVIDVLANDVDSDGDSLIIDSVDEESIQGGNVRVISGGDTNDEDSVTDSDNNSEDNATERIEYTPAEGFIGSDEFTYTISDGNGAIGSATVTITVNQVVIAPHPISYWLENENGITQGLLERAAEEHDSDSEEEEQEEWSFNLGNFRVSVEFDVSDNENDTRGILEAGQGSNNDDEEEDDDNSANVYDQLAAQLLAAKLNIENDVSTCEPIVTTIGYADTVLRDALYNGPGSTENPTDESSRDYAFELIEILDTYNNNGCV